MFYLNIKNVVIFLLILISTSIVANTQFEDNRHPSKKYIDSVAQYYGLNSIQNLTLLKLKTKQQSLDYSCGPAAVMSIMNYYGLLKDNQMKDATELKIVKEMGTNADIGTTPEQMVTWLKNHGFDVKWGTGGTLEMLQDNLKRGIPTLVEWIDWGGHWELVIGYNKAGKSPIEEKDTIFFADSSAHFDNVKYINGISAFNPDRFNTMWFDAQLFNPGHIIKGIYIIAIPKNLESFSSSRSN